MAESFLGRWSQRKQAMREGTPIEEPSQPLRSEVPVVEPAAGPAHSQPCLDEPGVDSIADPGALTPEAVAPPPTLQDVQALTPQSDFQRFVASDVDPEVKHAAMRKLFSDPHFNVMDGLDIYIDDYSQPDPLPLSMLRQLSSAQFLGVCCDVQEPATLQAEATETPDPVSVVEQAQVDPATSESEETPDHEHTDLRLQQDHAPGPQGPGRSAG
jgi:hypothetical protein